MRQNPHVRICGGPGSATTLVYPTREMAEAVQHGATAQCAGLSTPNARGGRADTDWRVDHELSSLIRTGTTTGGRSVSGPLL